MSLTMKTVGILALSLLVGKAAAVPVRTRARCHVFAPDPDSTTATSCQHVVSEEDVTTCGTVDNPCIAAADNVDFADSECGKCFKLKFQLDDVADEFVCTDGVCPGFSSELHIKVVDYARDGGVEFGVNQAGFSTLCPKVCFGSEICVNDEAHCLFGAYPEMDHPGLPGGAPFKYPGSCAARFISLEKEAEECTEHKDRMVAASGASDMMARSARCHVLRPGTPLDCDSYEVTEEDVTTCGTADKPCLTSGGECGECFKITYLKEDSDDAAVCKEGKCSGYTAEVFLKSTDKTIVPEMYGMSQAGWAVLCPHACMGSEICVQDPDECLHGSYFPQPYHDIAGNVLEYPGSCAVSSLHVQATKVDCATGGENRLVAQGETLPFDGPIEGRCHVFRPFTELECESLVVAEEHISDCGVDKPCISGAPMFHEGFECGKCYKVKYEKEVTMDPAICTGQGCKAYTFEVLIKIVDHESEGVALGMSQGAWETLCPQVCFGSEICVQDAADCLFGTYPSMDWTDLQGNPMQYPGSCAVSKLPLHVTEVDC